MRRFVILIAIVFGTACWCVPAHAQTAFALGADFVYPTADLGDVAGGGFGIRADILHPLNETTHFIAGVGSAAFGGVRVSAGTSSIEVQWFGVPVDLGIRFKVGEIAFIQAKGGLVYKSGEVADNLGNKVDATETAPLGNVGLGVQFNKWGVIGEYNLSNDSWQWFGLRGFYQFGG